MFHNYFKVALRNLKKHVGYSFINIAGLALGMACCILILAWVQDELGTDRFHAKADSLYIVRTIQHYGSETVTGSGSVPALGPALRAEFPEVRNAARIANGQGRYLLEYKDKQFREYAQLADPQIFEMFTFPFIKGDLKEVFRGPGVMVLSESAAKRIFGDEEPVGKTVTLDKADVFRVVAVMKDIPHNSTIRFDIWVPLELTQKWRRPNYISTWYNMAFRTYVELADGANVEAFNKKIFNRIRQSDPKTILEPLLFLFKNYALDIAGRKEGVRIFSIIAFLILIIACINFMNLTTARSARRAKEVGLRKVIGADRGQIMRQFFGESLLFTILSLVIAVGIILISLPAFRSLTGKPLYSANFLHPLILAGIVGVTLLTGFLAGSYPALLLSGFMPASVLKGLRDSGARGSAFRKGLVVIQFALSAMLIIGTIVIFSQVRYMKGKSLGFDREHLLYIPLEGELMKNIDTLKNEIRRHPGIQSVSATTHSPTGIYSNGQGWNWEGRNPNVDPLVTYFGVDPDFLNTFKMEMVQGESFRQASGMSPDVIINERFGEIIGSPNVIGMRLSQGMQVLRIMGVVKDFHFTPVDQEIGPILVYSDSTYRAFQPYRYLFIRLNPGDVPGSVAYLEKTVRKLNPGFPFEYRFLDEDYDQLYKSIEREMAIVRTFAGLAILISCLGLFGLAAYTAEQRTKEIGIRKVLGASMPGIVVLLSKEYAKWVLVANVIAWPVSYFLMKSWLKDYAYRISLSGLIFAASAILTLLVAQLTVSFQAFKAARMNPANSIRYE
jgi:putative ABC transport system permease protein